MRGFEIFYNEKKIDIGVNSGSVIVCYSADNLKVTGFDDDKFTRVEWVDIPISINDSIRIVASENIKESIEPYFTEARDPQSLLNIYLSMKNDLLAEGLLK